MPSLWLTGSNYRFANLELLDAHVLTLTFIHADAKLPVPPVMTNVLPLKASVICMIVVPLFPSSYTKIYVIYLYGSLEFSPAKRGSIIAYITAYLHHFSVYNHCSIIAQLISCKSKPITHVSYTLSISLFAFSTARCSMILRSFIFSKQVGIVECSASNFCPIKSLQSSWSQ